MHAIAEEPNALNFATEQPWAASVEEQPYLCVNWPVQRSCHPKAPVKNWPCQTDHTSARAEVGQWATATQPTYEQVRQQQPFHVACTDSRQTRLCG